MSIVLCYCSNCPNRTCVLGSKEGKCFSAIEEEPREELPSLSFGCISDEDKAVLQCVGGYLAPSKNGHNIKCCNDADYCNQYLNVTLKRLPSTDEFSFDSKYFSILLVIMIFGLVVSLAYFCYKKYAKTPRDLREASIKLKKASNMFPGFMSSSGSGSGRPLLVLASIGRQVTREYFLGRGRFTEVYVVKWNSNRIIEKLFTTSNESRWFRERTVYETALLRHKNVLGYISSDTLPTGLRAIYTDYHPLGSLHNYLDKVCLNYNDFFKLVRTAAGAISYLHTELVGTQKLPAVAHCNISSKNFLINDEKECVISNFENAVTFSCVTETIIGKPDFSSCTPNYLAPEIAIGTNVKDSFNALKEADIYSLGLVFYEICQRCTTVEGNRYTVEDHNLPFSQVLGACPSIEDVRKFYLTEKLTEELLFIPNRWENDEKVLKPFLQILKNCLYGNPDSRITSLRLRKKIESLEVTGHNDDADILESDHKRIHIS